MKKNIFISALVALMVSVLTIGGFSWLNKSQQKALKIEHIDATPSSSVLYTKDEVGDYVPLDFTRTAGQVMDAVVHIKSTQTHPVVSNRRNGQMPDIFGDDFFKRFFGPESEGRQGERRNMTPQPIVGTGSGVIINSEGYIVTNNHVIADADDIEVTLHDNRNYKASVIGVDPNTDLALLRIQEKNLPTLKMGDSEALKVGEWVLAVGNPFNLNSTVTAGIVSAKGRSINILREQYAIESFIQTDAAINPGNSGGALVNLNGDLIGINTAIASPTGAYSGYGFAVPVSIVSKVIEDLLAYGIVQRGYLGAMIRTVDGNFAKEKGLDVNSGVYVDSLVENSAAKVAGIKPGDVITTVSGTNIRTNADLLGEIARYRPGDEITMTINRNGKEKEIKVMLSNREGTTELVEKKAVALFETLGAELEPLSKKDAQKMNIAGGVKIDKLIPGKLRQQTDIQPGFIITKVDGKAVKDVDDLEKALKGKSGGVMLEGFYEGSSDTRFYAFGL